MFGAIAMKLHLEPTWRLSDRRRLERKSIITFSLIVVYKPVVVMRGTVTA